MYTYRVEKEKCKIKNMFNTIQYKTFIALSSHHYDH